MSEETWKDAAGYEAHYQVSNLGRIRSKDRLVKCSVGSKTRLWRGKIMSLKGRAGRGYVSVALSVEGKSTRINLHRLVAITFVPNPEDKPDINHRDSDKTNNRVDNLEWMTKEEHALFGYHVEGHSTPRKLTCEEAEDIRKLLAAGTKQQDVADMYGLCQANISLINTRRTWND